LKTYKDTNKRDEISFGENGKRPPSTVGVPLLTEGTKRMGRPKRQWWDQNHLRIHTDRS